MDLFDSKRQERLEAARKAATASKEASLKIGRASCRERVCLYV